VLGNLGRQHGIDRINTHAGGRFLGFDGGLQVVSEIPGHDRFLSIMAQHGTVIQWFTVE